MSAAPKPASLCILGSTGSIGVNTLAVAQHLQIPIHAISAHNKYQELIEQAITYNVQQVVISNEAHYAAVKEALASYPITVSAGPEALNDIAASDQNSVVMTAIVGAAGLAPTLAACESGKRVCIANKEPLVIAGDLIMRCAQQHSAQIIPVDSEHSAIFQCLEQHQLDEVAHITLTGSGGPLRGCQDLSSISKAAALQHPNWDMGEKITIDSATLMNKGLELIEAHHLFSIPSDDIRVLIHPQSIIHSMVAYKDGSVIAQLGLPDMRTPIQYALTWPRHLAGPVAVPNFSEIAQLTFEDPDHQYFPSINYARAALAAGELGPCVLNATNECAVAGFLAEQLSFTDIFKHLESSLQFIPDTKNASLDDILACDQETRLRFNNL